MDLEVAVTCLIERKPYRSNHFYIRSGTIYTNESYRVVSIVTSMETLYFYKHTNARKVKQCFGMDVSKGGHYPVYKFLYSWT